MFPFLLPTRRLAFHSVGEETSISPSGEFRLVHIPDDFEGSEIDLAVEDRVVRKISFRGGEAFRADTKALGWQSDSSRFFVVIQFGHDRALLSFSVEGQDDYWEKLLTDDPTEWRDGFVLEPAKLVPKRTDKKAVKK